MTTHELLPEGTTFQINGEKLSISVPESLATKQAKAERLAEKATQWAHHGTSGRQGLNGSLQLVQSLLPRAQQLDQERPVAGRHHSEASLAVDLLED